MRWLLVLLLTVSALHVSAQQPIPPRDPDTIALQARVRVLETRVQMLLDRIAVLEKKAGVKVNPNPIPPATPKP